MDYYLWLKSLHVMAIIAWMAGLLYLPRLFVYHAGVAKGSHTLENRIRRGSVAVYPLGVAVFVEAIVDVGDDARDQDPLAGFRRVYTSRYYAVYANC